MYMFTDLLFDKSHVLCCAFIQKIYRQKDELHVRPIDEIIPRG
jgi:hypothetical protein